MIKTFLNDSRSVTYSNIGQLLCLIVLFPFLCCEADSETEPKLQGKVTVFDAARVSPGLTLVPRMNARIELISEAGKLINRWKVDATRAKLIKDGGLLVLHASNWGRNRPKWSKLKKNIRIYNNQSEVIWDYKADDFAHHDIRELDNGNFIFLQRTYVPEEKKKLIKDPERKNFPEIRTDSIVEINRNKEKVYQWNFWENVDINYCGADECRIEDWTHVNTVSVLSENQWYKSGHKEFTPGNIMIMPRTFSAILIFDRKSGKVVWEYRGDYKGGLDKSHEPYMIPAGFPGAGNIIIFDNGVKKHPGESYILEINPVTKKVVWKYDRGTEFFSRTRAAVQRLKNGNTLISEDKKGRCFEVTPEGETVWLYDAGEEINRCGRYPASYFNG